MDPASHDAQLRQAAFSHVNRLSTLRGGVLDSAPLSGRAIAGGGGLAECPACTSASGDNRRPRARRGALPSVSHAGRPTPRQRLISRTCHLPRSFRGLRTGFREAFRAGAREGLVSVRYDRREDRSRAAFQAGARALDARDVAPLHREMCRCRSPSPDRLMGCSLRAG